MLALMAFLVYAQYIYWDQWITIMNSIVYILLGMSLFCFTLFTVYFLTKHKGDVGTKEFDKKFSSFYDNQRVSLPYSYSYIVIFLVRRLLYTMSMQWFGLAAQLALQLFTSLGSLMFLLAVRPMETPLFQLLASTGN